jgi:hypothetical protein
MNWRRLQAWALRLVGLVEICAFAAVVMPAEWMKSGQAILGSAAMPTDPIFDTVMRQVSFTYGMHGVGMWIIAADVVRYRPLVILSAVGYLLAAPAFFAIERVNGMPWSWSAGNSGSCLLVGLVLSGLLLAERAGGKKEVS